MFPVTTDKFLLTFLGKTLLQHQVSRAMAAGMRDFIIVSNPQSRANVEAIAAGISGARIQVIVQQQPNGIADALESASHLFDDELLVVNPNDVFDESAYRGLLAARAAAPASSYITGYVVQRYFPGGYLVVAADDSLRRIVEKPGPGSEPSDIVNIMVHLHTDPARLMHYIRQARTEKDDVYECAMDAMVRDGHRSQVVRYRDAWTPIKYPWHIVAAARHFLKQSAPSISPHAHISDKATVVGDVTIADNVKVFENAVIRGPAYIGPNSVIGNGALVRDGSHIGANCVIGFATEVKGSYIDDDCWFHSNYVGDCIIGQGCSFGAGTIFANFRFDEGNIPVRMNGEMVDSGLDKLGAMLGPHCKTGINVSIMPGVRIGANTIVGSHASLTKDVEPDKIVVTESQCRTLSNEIILDELKKDELMRRLRKS